MWTTVWFINFQHHSHFHALRSEDRPQSDPANVDFARPGVTGRVCFVRIRQSWYDGGFTLFMQVGLDPTLGWEWPSAAEGIPRRSLML